MDSILSNSAKVGPIDQMEPVGENSDRTPLID